MIHTRITGTGSYLPGEPVSNAALIAKHQLESSDEWIAERTGIRARHIAIPGENSSDLALKASQRALAAAGKNANDIDLLIVATSTPDYIFPVQLLCCRRNWALPTVRLRLMCKQCVVVLFMQ